MTWHWNQKVVILTTFSSLVAPEVVRRTPSGATSDEKVVNMTTFWFQWIGDEVCFPFWLNVLIVYDLLKYGSKRESVYQQQLSPMNTWNTMSIGWLLSLDQSFFSLFVAFPIQPHAWRQTDTKSTKISGDKLWRQASQGCTTCLNGVINLCCVINIIPSDHIKLCTIHFDNYCVNWFSWPTIKHIWNALSLKVKKIINTHPSMNNHFVGQFTKVTKQCIPTSQTLCLPHPKPHQRYWKLKDYLSSQR